jgi:hypothetical protein
MNFSSPRRKPVERYHRTRTTPDGVELSAAYPQQAVGHQAADYVSMNGTYSFDGYGIVNNFNVHQQVPIAF